MPRRFALTPWDVGDVGDVGVFRLEPIVYRGVRAGARDIIASICRVSYFETLILLESVIGLSRARLRVLVGGFVCWLSSWSSFVLLEAVCSTIGSVRKASHGGYMMTATACSGSHVGHRCRPGAISNDATDGRRGQRELKTTRRLGRALGNVKERTESPLAGPAHSYPPGGSSSSYQGRD